MVIHIVHQFIIAGKKTVQLDKVIMVMEIVQVVGSLGLPLLNLKVKQLIKYRLQLLEIVVVDQVL